MPPPRQPGEGRARADCGSGRRAPPRPVAPEPAAPVLKRTPAPSAPPPRPQVKAFLSDKVKAGKVKTKVVV
jgi:hypothetical protein